MFNELAFEVLILSFLSLLNLTTPQPGDGAAQSSENGRATGADPLINFERVYGVHPRPGVAITESHGLPPPASRQLRMRLSEKADGDRNAAGDPGVFDVYDQEGPVKRTVCGFLCNGFLLRKTSDIAYDKLVYETLLTDDAVAQMLANRTD